MPQLNQSTLGKLTEVVIKIWKSLDPVQAQEKGDENTLTDVLSLIKPERYEDPQAKEKGLVLLKIIREKLAAQIPT